MGLQAEDPTIADLLKEQGYSTGQFGKNHLGDRNEYLPTVHGFDEFFGNLYHLNAEEDPEDPDYPAKHGFERFRGEPASNDVVGRARQLARRPARLAAADARSRPAPRVRRS